MKNPLHPTPAKKMPKARVMFASQEDGDIRYHRTAPDAAECISHTPLFLRDPKASFYPVAILPVSTPRQAKELVRFANMTEEEKIERLAEAIWKESGSDSLSTPWVKLREYLKAGYRDSARAALAAQGFITPPRQDKGGRKK